VSVVAVAKAAVNGAVVPSSAPALAARMIPLG